MFRVIKTSSNIEYLFFAHKRPDMDYLQGHIAHGAIRQYSCANWFTVQQVILVCIQKCDLIYHTMEMLQHLEHFN